MDEQLRKQVIDVINNTEITHTILASSLNLSRSHFSSWLNGSFNFKDCHSRKLKSIVDSLNSLFITL